MLTHEDYQFLKRNGRRFKMTRDESLVALEQAGLPAEDWILDFQTTYGGYCPENGLVYGILSPTLDECDESRIEYCSEQASVRIDLDNSTQVRYWLRADGIVQFEDYKVAESFESYLRLTAYCSQFFNSPKWIYIDDQRRTTKKYADLLMNLNAEIVSEASDRWHQVHRSESHVDIQAGKFRRLYMRSDFVVSRKK